MGIRTPGASLLMGLLILLTLAGCSGEQTAASPSASASQPAAVSPSDSSPPAASSPASDTVASPPTLPASPPPASVDPGVDPAKTGKVTAIRLADPLTGWAGGDGWLAKTLDGGKHWEIQYRHQYVVDQIFALNAMKAWATLDIGDKRGRKLVRTTDGGKHWTDAGTVPGYGFFHFVSDKEAFSGGARTTDGGKTWTSLPSAGRTVGDPYFHDRLNGWAVTNGRHGFSIRRTTDGGKTWPAVLTRGSEVLPGASVIRSTGRADAWVELIGDSGMTQTSYSLFHTSSGGKTWQPVLANSGAGSGPAPGFPMGEKTAVPRNSGNSPGMLYAVNPSTAFMGAQCQACEKPNMIGKTTDGGKTWMNLKGEYPGYGPQLIAAADASHVWWIHTDNADKAPSRMYVTEDGGKHWTLVHTFDTPQ
jgi:photosystem II stability/assembly factor-like uncharacterized protein